MLGTGGFILLVCLVSLVNGDIEDGTMSGIDDYRMLMEAAIGHDSLSEEIARIIGDDEELVQTSASFDVGSKNSCLWGPAPAPLIKPEVADCPETESRPAIKKLPVYVITLMSSDVRRTNSECLLRELALQAEAANVEIVPKTYAANGGQNVVQLPWNVYHSRGSMKSGEVGVFLSHTAIWNEIVQNGDEHALVFEDDAQITDNLIQQLLLSSNDLSGDWDMVWLFESPAAKLSHQFNHPATAISCKSHILKKNHGIGLDGYLIGKNGAERLLAKVLPIVGLPIDLVLHNLIQDKAITAYLTNPPLVYDDFELKSEIQHRYYTELRGLSKHTGRPRTKHNATETQAPNSQVMVTATTTAPTTTTTTPTTAATTQAPTLPSSPDAVQSKEQQQQQPKKPHTHAHHRTKLNKNKQGSATVHAASDSVIHALQPNPTPAPIAPPVQPVPVPSPSPSQPAANVMGVGGQMDGDGTIVSDPEPVQLVLHVKATVQEDL